MGVKSFCMRFWTNPGSNGCVATYLPSLQTIKVRQERRAKHWWESEDKLISYVFLWNPLQEHSSVGLLAKTDIHQLCVDTKCHLEDLPRVMTDRDVWRERVKGNLWCHGPAVRVFANGPGDLGSIPGRVIPKTLKIELDTTLLNTQHYKVRFKGKVEQSWEWSSALPYTLV